MTNGPRLFDVWGCHICVDSAAKAGKHRQAEGLVAGACCIRGLGWGMQGPVLTGRFWMEEPVRTMMAAEYAASAQTAEQVGDCLHPSLPCLNAPRSFQFVWTDKLVGDSLNCTIDGVQGVQWCNS